ncbi:acyltransferase [bacterium]|nr:acyltransferase [bacterium]
MFGFIPGIVRGVLILLTLTVNLFFWVVFLLPFAVIKLALPHKPVRRICDVALNFICTRWASVNGFVLTFVNSINWHIEGIDNLSMKDWYLVLANHQSWADIVVLQYVLNNRIPYFRFFLKKELVWLPIFNFVWAALDYPYMKRYSKTFLKKNPHLKGKDIETTKKSCEKFRDTPVSIMNFVEGTRFSKEKHTRQNSPYRYLLQPKAGGVAFVLAAMGNQLTSILDVTIKYEPKALGIWDFFCGRVPEVTVRVEHIAITEEIIGDYFNDEAFKSRFQHWTNKLWGKKDLTLGTLHGERPN